MSGRFTPDEIEFLLTETAQHLAEKHREFNWRVFRREFSERLWKKYREEK